MSEPRTLKEQQHEALAGLRAGLVGAVFGAVHRAADNQPVEENIEDFGEQVKDALDAIEMHFLCGPKLYIVHPHRGAITEARVFWSEEEAKRGLKASQETWKDRQFILDEFQPGLSGDSLMTTIVEGSHSGA